MAPSSISRSSRLASFATGTTTIAVGPGTAAVTAGAGFGAMKTEIDRAEGGQIAVMMTGSDEGSDVPNAGTIGSKIAPRDARSAGNFAGNDDLSGEQIDVVKFVENAAVQNAGVTFAGSSVLAGEPNDAGKFAVSGVVQNVDSAHAASGEPNVANFEGGAGLSDARHVHSAEARGGRPAPVGVVDASNVAGVVTGDADDVATYCSQTAASSYMSLSACRSGCRRLKLTPPVASFPDTGLRGTPAGAADVMLRRERKIMDMQQISDLARMMIEAHGDQAAVAAARRQAEEEKLGNTEESATWKRVRAAIAQRRGPHES